MCTHSSRFIRSSLLLILGMGHVVVIVVIKVDKGRPARSAFLSQPFILNGHRLVIRILIIFMARVMAHFVNNVNLFLGKFSSEAWDVRHVLEERFALAEVRRVVVRV